MASSNLLTPLLQEPPAALPSEANNVIDHLLEDEPAQRRCCLAAFLLGVRNRVLGPAALAGAQDKEMLEGPPEAPLAQSVDGPSEVQQTAQGPVILAHKTNEELQSAESFTEKETDPAVVPEKDVDIIALETESRNLLSAWTGDGDEWKETHPVPLPQDKRRRKRRGRGHQHQPPQAVSPVDPTQKQERWPAYNSTPGLWDLRKQLRPKWREAAYPVPLKPGRIDPWGLVTPSYVAAAFHPAPVWAAWPSAQFLPDPYKTFQHPPATLGAFPQSNGTVWLGPQALPHFGGNQAGSVKRKGPLKPR